jgi:hypothetical protein
MNRTRLDHRPVHRGMSRLHRDQRGFVLGFFLRLLLVMAVLAFAVEEGGQIVVAQIHAEDAARAAAQAAANVYFNSRGSGRSTSAAYVAARQAAIDAARQNGDARVQSVTIGHDGAATVEVKETAKTVVVSRVSFLRNFGVQHASDEETHSSS